MSFTWREGDDFFGFFLSFCKGFGPWKVESKVGASIKQELLHLGKNQAREKPRLVILYHKNLVIFQS